MVNDNEGGSMSKFKVGDRVKVTSKDSFNERVGEVSKVHRSRLAYNVKFEHKPGEYGFEERELALAERTKSDIVKEIAGLWDEWKELHQSKLPTEPGIYYVKAKPHVVYHLSRNGWSQLTGRAALRPEPDFPWEGDELAKVEIPQK